MKAIKYLAFVAICMLAVACEKTEWDVITPAPSELYGNNSITNDNIVTIAQLKQMYPNVFASTDENALVDRDVKIKARVTALASEFPYLDFIAWDILLTEQGMCVIEANASSGVNIIQLWGGQRHGELGEVYRRYGIIK